MENNSGLRCPIEMHDGGELRSIGMRDRDELRCPIEMIADNKAGDENNDECSSYIGEMIEDNCYQLCGKTGVSGEKSYLTQEFIDDYSSEVIVDPTDLIKKYNEPTTYKSIVQINNVSPTVTVNTQQMNSYVGDICKYGIQDGILCAFDKQDQVVKILGNYELQLVALVVKFDKSDNKRKKYRINIDVYNLAKRKRTTFIQDVEVGKVKDRKWLDDACESRINYMDSKYSDFIEYLHWVLETSDYNTVYEYEKTGWIQLSDKKIYLDINGAVGASYPNIRCLGDYSILNTQKYSDIDNFKQVLNMINITKNIRCSLPLLILTHTSVLRKLFNEAGYPVKFIMAYIGETNSKKTSIALVLTRFLREIGSNNASPSVSFEGTVSGLQEALTMFPDAVQIIDDYRPSNDWQDEKELNTKLEKITRVIGDNNSVKRMTIFSSKSIPNLTPSTTCLITGEIPCTGNSSTAARIINVMTDREQSNDSMLTLYQENPQILGNHMYDFIAYISENYEYVLLFIKTMFTRLREQYKGSFRLPRLIDSLCILQITCEVLLDYAVKRCFIDISQREQLAAPFIGELYEVVKSNDNDIEESTPEVTITHALKHAIAKQTIRVEALSIENIKLSVVGDTDESIIYSDDNYYYILLDTLFRVVQEANRKHKQYSPYNTPKKLKSLLVIKKMIETNIGSEKRDQERLPCGANYVKHRFLYLKRSVIDNL